MKGEPAGSLSIRFATQMAADAFFTCMNRSPPKEMESLRIERGFEHQARIAAKGKGRAR